MKAAEVRVGFAMTGSYCTYGKVFPVLEALTKQYGVILPILSEHSAHTDTRFGTSADHQRKMEQLCGRKALTTIPEVESIGPKKLLDVLVIAPCTGNTLAKMALGITDTSVTMAAKAHLRNGRPVILAPSTNDGLAVSLRNLGDLLCRKHIYVVPFRQDDPTGKPNSLVSDMTQIPAAINAALEGRQLQPVLLGVNQ